MTLKCGDINEVSPFFYFLLALYKIFLQKKGHLQNSDIVGHGKLFPDKNRKMED